jgi:hypothetical protein
MGIEHHFHALTMIGNNTKFAAMAKTEMRYFHRLGYAAQDYLLMTPVKLDTLPLGQIAAE